MLPEQLLVALHGQDYICYATLSGKTFMFRSSRLQMFFKIGVLQNFSNSTGNAFVEVSF